MSYQTLITLPWKLERDPPPFEGNDIKFPESFARHIIKQYTKKGDAIIDPFAGLGTSLFIAEEMGRIPFGMELDEKKHQWVAGQLENWTHLIHDDAAKIQKYNFPKIDLIITSPPYMPSHHQWNPLYNGDPTKAGYDKYLKRLSFIIAKLRPLMKKNTPLIIQADNLHHRNNFTPLVRDISHCLSKNFKQIDEMIVQWDNPKPDYPFTRYLVFKKK